MLAEIMFTKHWISNVV